MVKPVRETGDKNPCQSYPVNISATNFFTLAAVKPQILISFKGHEALSTEDSQNLGRAAR